MEDQIIVVGGGISGLCAAYKLKKKNKKVLLLEAQDRLGGRTLTVHRDGFGHTDVGGTYIGPTQEALLRLLKELGIQHLLTPVYTDGKFVTIINKKVYTHKEEADPPVRNFLVSLDIKHFFKEFDKLADKVPVNVPWMAPNAEQLDKMTYKEYVDKKCWTSSGRQLAYWFVQINAAVDPHSCSLLWFLWYVKQCGGVKTINACKGGAQEMKMKHGMSDLSQKLGEILQSEIKLNSVVSQIHQNYKGVVVRTIDGTTYKGSRVILALPPTLQSKITFTPQLPMCRNQLIQRMPMGSVWKMKVFYKDAFWRRMSYSGSISSTITPGTFPIVYTLDDSHHDGSHPALMAFVAGESALHISKMTREERLGECKKFYADAFGTDEALHHVGYEERTWCNDEHSGGCYTSVCLPGVLTSFQDTIRRPFKLIFFAGTETATSWSGYISGAVEAGERAAREALDSLQDTTYL